MRKNLFVASVMAVLLCGAAFADVSITAENFPDNVFRAYVSENFDSDGDGTLSDAEIASVVRIPATLTYSYDTSTHTLTQTEAILKLATVSNFKGIEYFTNLEALSCGGLVLSVMMNLASNDKLIFFHCESMTLQSLDLSGKSSLLYVDCPNVGLESLDVSDCWDLVYLNCSHNSISSLELSDNSALDYLDCSNNHLARLDLTEIEEPAVAKCVSQSITGGYVSRIPSSSGYNWEFSFAGIIPSSEFTRIQGFSAYDSANAEIASTKYASGVYHLASAPARIVYLYNVPIGVYNLVSAPTGGEVYITGYSLMDVTITSIDVREFHPPVITTTSLPKGTQSIPYSTTITASGDTPISWDVQGLPAALSYDSNTSGKTLKVSGIPEVTGSFDVTVTARNAISADTKKFLLVIVSPDGVALSDFGEWSKDIGSYDRKPPYGRITPDESKDITDLPHGLNYGYPPVTNPRPRGLTWPIGGGNGILRRLPNLRRLYISGGWGGSSWPGKGDGSGGGTTPIDLTGNTNLEVLIIENVHLGTIDLSRNTKLRILILINCGLTALNLNKNTALEYLDCSYNYLSVLDLSVNVSLRYIYMHHNYLPHVSLQANTAVITAECHSQDLTGELKDSGDTTNPYEFDLRVLPISEGNIGNVVQGTIRAYDASGGTVAVTWNNGVLRFRKVVSRVIYYYRTGRGDILLEVRVRLTYNGSEPVTPPVSPDYPPNPEVPNTKPVITTASRLPDGEAGTEYPKQLAATGSAPLRWSLFSGSLPAGLSITSSGLITGTPTATGMFMFTVLVQNPYGEDRREFIIKIGVGSGNNDGKDDGNNDGKDDDGKGGGNNGSKPDITAIYTLNDGYIGVWYSATLYAEGTLAISWRLTSGSLPVGLTLNSDGTVTGIPKAAGEYIFTVEAVNSWGKDVAVFRITIYTDSGQCCSKESTGLIYECTRGISALTEYELGMLPEDIYIIAYVFPRFRVVRAGTYRFTVNLYNTVPAGLTLVWFPFAVSGTGGKRAYFWDSTGTRQITVSPADRRGVVSVYLDVGTYAPVIAVLRPSEVESEDEKGNVGGSGGGGGGGCDAGVGAGMLLAVVVFRKR